MSVTVHENDPGEDIAATCAAIHAAAFEPTGSRAWSKEEIIALASRETSVLFTLPGGFLLIDVVADEAELLSVAVAPDRQGQGLAHTLLREMIKSLSIRQVAKCTLEVAVSNSTAIHLYDSFGFERIGQRKNYFRQVSGLVDALVMTRVFDVHEFKM